MSRDQRFPGWKMLRKVDKQTDSPMLVTVTVGVLIEVVLAIFATQTHALFNLFSASTLMPAVIYFVTVILYVLARKRLPATQGFSLRRWEIPVIVVSLVWLAFEISIFRASTFGTPWAYAGIMTAIGLLYFGYMIVTRRSLAMPGAPGGDPASGVPPAAPPVSGAPAPGDR
jgi:amino acid transporter